MENLHSEGAAAGARPRERWLPDDDVAVPVDVVRRRLRRRQEHPRELAEALQLSLSSATQLVRRTQRAGLIRRVVSTADGRVNYLRLTEEGERRLAKAVAHLRTERRRLRAALSDRAGASRPVTGS